MYIEKIIDEDGEGHSWDVTISDGEHKLLCFAGFEINKNSRNIKLDCYFAEEIKKTEKTEFSIEKHGISCYEYRIVAKVTDAENGLLVVYGFEFILDDNLPQNINNGNFIEFICLRMDCHTLEIN